MTASTGKPDDRLVLTPTRDRFAALARSSPWRWRSLRFELSQRCGADTETVRAWLRRPNALRVEDLDGAVLHRELSDEPPTNATVTFVSASANAAPEPVRPARDPLHPTSPLPELDADGLVARRPSSWDVAYDDPMYNTYYWVALLDPAELADGADEDGPTDQPPVTISELTEVTHHGRPAWQAVLRPTDCYEPRCDCCSLLLSATIVRQLKETFGDSAARLQPPEAYRVRLDLATAVCVYSEPLGGAESGPKHDMRIEAVDEPMSDALFLAG